MTFEETYLNDNILDALYDMHFEEMTPIQEKCIPEILDGQDLIGVAQTGTGKTAAYSLLLAHYHLAMSFLSHIQRHLAHIP